MTRLATALLDLAGLTGTRQDFQQTGLSNRVRQLGKDRDEIVSAFASAASPKALQDVWDR